VLPSAPQTASASRNIELSRLNTWPTVTPVNASSLASQPATHDSGTMRFALPFIVRDLHPLLLPVSRRTRGFDVLDFFLGVKILPELRTAHVSPTVGSNGGFKRLP